MWELDDKESWVPKNGCFWTVVLEKFLESPLDYKEIQTVHPKGNQSWILIGRLMLKMKLQYSGHLLGNCDSFEKTLMLGRLKAGGEGDDNGWDGWMGSQTWRTWVWVNSGSCWWTGRRGVLQSMGSQRIRQDWATELNGTSLPFKIPEYLPIASWVKFDSSRATYKSFFDLSYICLPDFISPLTFLSHHITSCLLMIVCVSSYGSHFSGKFILTSKIRMLKHVIFMATLPC